MAVENKNIIGDSQVEHKIFLYLCAVFRVYWWWIFIYDR